MSREKTLPSRRTPLRALANEIAKFAAVGGLGIAVNFAVFNLCRAVTSMATVKCSFIGTSVAIVANYLGFRYFAYRDRRSSEHTREFALFVLFSVAGLVIENGVLYSATSWFGWNTALQSNLFKALGIGTATCFRFCSYRTWVFKAKAGGGPVGQPRPSEEE
ncbi:GtrA family protein [Streptomyces winkii]|uniref:GtrA family protein n=1 Tax=Streptomyces winkii TaxID=3051178 RepID=UPI0028D3FE49|nr:GtrA family protein [Streptomyces sp. DSM 40971]